VSERQESLVTRLLIRAVRVPVVAWQLTRRIAGYVLSSSDDVRGVYGDDPNRLRDGSNVSGNIAANVTGGMGQ
jgi:hypothetical protein